MSATRIGPYVALEEIGRGGMAVVHRAVDERTGRTVALKRPLDGTLRDPQALRQVFREVRLAARLRHPHVVALLGALEHDGAPCLVLEHVAGRALYDVLRDSGLLPLHEVLRIGSAIADALAFIHERGIVHQDVSTSNVLLAHDTVKLADFGLARLAAGRVVAAGRRYEVAGTPAYLAPEQVLGHALDGRADVFALGAVLYEAWTGRPAFAGATLDDVLEAVVAAAPVPCSALRPDTPRALEAALAAALTKEREARCDAAHLGGLLAECARGTAAS